MNLLSTFMWFKLGEWSDRRDYSTFADFCYRYALDGRKGLAGEAGVRLSQRMLDRNRDREAVEISELGLRKDSSNARLWRSLGAAQRKLKEMPAARDAFNQAIIHDPSSSQAWSDLGEWHFSQGDCVVALELLDRALRVDSEILEALTNRPNALYELGRFAEAEAGARTAIERHPSAANQYINIGNVLLRKNKTLADIETDIDKLIGASRYDDALANMTLGVYHHHQVPEASHKNQYLYCPTFDQQILTLVGKVVTTCKPHVNQLRGDSTLIIATEMYQVGGHSRVILDVMTEVPSPVLLLTDLFGRYRNTPDNLDWLLDRCGESPVIIMPQRSLWAKCRALSQLTERINPCNILYINNHHDPIPFVATLGHVGSRKTLIHHCDHDPSLGNTLPGIGHVDFTHELAAICATKLHRDTRVLPLYAPDAGKKYFAPLANNAYSVVTSGSPDKFARSGEMALQSIAQAVLTSVGGKFFHIGPLDSEWQAEIRNHLDGCGIDPTRFEPLGWVGSLWNKLAELNAHFYLGSAPVGGGRAAIEAQGCGYPVVFFRNELGSVLAVDSLYASKQLGWATLTELTTLLLSIGPQQTQLSDAARLLYERRYSRDEFRRVLKEILSR